MPDCLSFVQFKNAKAETNGFKLWMKGKKVNNTIALQILSCNEVIKVGHTALVTVTLTQISSLQITKTVRETESKSMLTETQRWDQMGRFPLSR